jgi:hypothetical protein
MAESPVGQDVSGGVHRRDHGQGPRRAGHQPARLRSDRGHRQRRTRQPQAAADRLSEKWPNARLVHLPVHASWLDQIEIYFSIVQRKVVTPNDLTDLDAVAQRLLDFQDRYNHTATPFAWKFTRTDLDALLERIAAHERDNPLPVAA